MSSKNNDRLFDLRTLNSFITNGKVKPTDLDKHLKTLPDDEGQYDIVELEEEDEVPIEE